MEKPLACGGAHIAAVVPSAFMETIATPKSSVSPVRVPPTAMEMTRHSLTCCWPTQM